MRTSTAAALAGGLTAAFGAACVAWGTFVEGTDYHLRQVRVPLLPEGHAPLKVLHISDIHLMPNQRAKIVFLRHLASLRPDVVIDTGDNIASAASVEPLLDSLGDLLDVPGGVVFGSNDFTGPVLKNPFGYLTGTHSDRNAGELPSDELRAGLTARAWRWLEGERVVVDVRGTRLELRGTGDAHIDRAAWGVVEGPRAEGTDVVLGVSHAPYQFLVDAAAADDVDLLLCGHTHGGQVCVPTPWGRTEGRALTTNCDLPASRVKGLSRVERADREDLFLHVSAGLGMSPFAPFRFACPPEATMLTLVARD